MLKNKINKNNFFKNHNKNKTKRKGKKNVFKKKIINMKRHCNNLVFYKESYSAFPTCFSFSLNYYHNDYLLLRVFLKFYFYLII